MRVIFGAATVIISIVTLIAPIAANRFWREMRLPICARLVRKKIKKRRTEMAEKEQKAENENKDEKISVVKEKCYQWWMEEDLAKYLDRETDAFVFRTLKKGGLNDVEAWWALALRDDRFRNKRFITAVQNIKKFLIELIESVGRIKKKGERKW